MERIEHIEARCWHVPLNETLHDSKHAAHTHFELVTARVRLSDGLEGTGYTYTGGRGGHAILAVIEHDLQPFLLGQPADDVEALNAAMGWHLHYVGRRGIAGFAVSALDIALWDLRGKARSGARSAPCNGALLRHAPRHRPSTVTPPGRCGCRTTVRWRRTFPAPASRSAGSGWRRPRS